MPNATVGVQAVLTRLLPTRTTRVKPSVRFHHRNPSNPGDGQVRATSLPDPLDRARRAPTSPPTALSAPRARVGPDAAAPLSVVAIVVAASVLSWLPGQPARGAVGGTTSDHPAPRVAYDDGARSYSNLTPVYGTSRALDGQGGAAATQDVLRAPAPDFRRLDPEAVAAARATESADPAALRGPFLADATLLKPVAVATTLADGRDLLREYKVKKGDSLESIGKRFGVSAMTVVWANGLKSPVLTVGETLRIPPMNGVVHRVREGDSLESLAKQYKIDADRIYDTNGLEDPVLIAGQTLVLPGAKGAPLPKPKPVSRSSGGSTTVRPPATYSGGSMAWPVVGGGNYISQYYRTGHYGIDIAADHGSAVRAAAGGTVTFAGWKSNGGGYQVWIAHGSGLYTTYNHMSGVSVGSGQRVARGQQVGRVGQSGWATGPHLHFEVWKGAIWNGGTRVNPLRYL